MAFPLLAAIPIIGDLIKGAFGIIDKFVEDKDKAAELKAQLQTQFMSLDYSAFETEINRRAEIITAEIKGESWLQRNWRPLLMLVCIAIVADNYLIGPYLRALFSFTSPVRELPERLWSLMQLGVGWYVVGRSAEKITSIWKNGKNGGANEG